VATVSDADELYRALLQSEALKERRRLQYRCERRCLLLDAIDAGPLGVVVHQNRYKLSTEQNLRRSNEDGRRANTYDGANHWRERSYFLEQSALAWPDDEPQPRLSLQCDHVGVLADGTNLTITAQAYRDDWNRGHAEVIVRRDGSRYAVT
jgi:hypothetical protein